MSTEQVYMEETTETHRLRTAMILLVLVAVSFGVWYLISERD